ncbi:transposase [Haloquadratum walsbyi]|uniref:Transposase n=1 Tax=Haloquadratum walsbyi J07HQW2 TaxID=1238425 RepID=U1PWS9_9EURY|nr:transposase [Haloquadratum walsbyi]ERG96876.1 MAG: transposase [Haloquadratum walsbyi J07HQW2]
MQSGFEFKFEFEQQKRSDRPFTLSFETRRHSNHITIHREVPDGVTVKEVSIKKERTGEWYASFAAEGKGEPAKLENPDRCVGIDVGILKYAHDTDGRAVGSLDLDLDLQNERERLTREQRSLCSPPQTVLTLWMYSASLKQEAEAEAEAPPSPSPEPRQRLSRVG